MARDRAAAAKSRDDADRKPHRSAHHAGEPQILRCRAAQVCRASQGGQRAAGAIDERRRQLQSVQRQVRTSHRRSGFASGRHVDEAERQGAGRRRALRRRGVCHCAAEDGAAVGDHRRRPYPARRHEQGIDETLERRTPRPGDHLDRRGAAAADRYAAIVDRARRQVPLRRQAQRPQSGDLRDAMPRPTTAPRSSPPASRNVVVATSDAVSALLREGGARRRAQAFGKAPSGWAPVPAILPSLRGLRWRSQATGPCGIRPGGCTPRQNLRSAGRRPGCAKIPASDG